MVQKDIKAILENLEEEKEKHSKKEDNKVFDPSESPTLSLYEEVNSAIVVGCLLKGEDSSEVEADLKELGSLLFTLGIKVCGSFIQKVEKFSSKSLIGTGKIQEILKEALDKKVGMIVFDRNVDFLTPFCSNYTFEGLLDEHFGINKGCIIIENSYDISVTRVYHITFTAICILQHTDDSDAVLDSHHGYFTFIALMPC